MFGYITPDKPELKISEFEIFRGYYCGVCKAIAKRAGHRGRFILSYDSAFLALLLDSLSSAPVSGEHKRCPVHPLNKRFIVNCGDVLEFSSDINILLAYYNLKDKWQDERKLFGPLGLLALRRGYKRVKKKHAALVRDIEKGLSELNELERSRCGQMDEASEPFAGIMQKVFEYPAESDSDKKILGWIGYNLGKWIYLLDAYDDIEDNIKRGAYNPLVIQFRYGENEDIGSFKERIKKEVEFILVYSLSEMEKAFSLLDVKKNRGILENIIYRGLLTKTRQVLEMGAG
ncbi:MAG: hypothetical protein GX494_03060 [Clostridiaceae bacterium]|nr:hypothetical protein [Clostridiaceae bacterium]